MTRSRILPFLALSTLLVGCAGSADHPPTPMSAQFDMKPVPKTGGGIVSGAVDAPVQLFHVLTGNAPIRYVRMMENDKLPDERRKGIVALSARGFGQKDPYTRRYRQIAQSDPDYLVRAAAIRALNASRDREAIPEFIAALSDASDKVRLQAAKALSNIPDPSAAEPLTRVLGNQTESKDVRVAASEALRHYRNASVARVLTAALTGRDFGIAWQSRWSLKILTGQDFRYDEQAWTNYFKENPLT